MSNWFIKYFPGNNEHGFGRIPDPLEPPDDDPPIAVGDWLKCKDKYDMVDTMMRLADEDIEAEYRYRKDGKSGYWLEVIAIDN